MSSLSVTDREHALRHYRLEELRKQWRELNLELVRIAAEARQIQQELLHEHDEDDNDLATLGERTMCTRFCSQYHNEHLEGAS